MSTVRLTPRTLGNGTTILNIYLDSLRLHGVNDCRLLNAVSTEVKEKRLMGIVSVSILKIWTVILQYDCRKFHDRRK